MKPAASVSDQKTGLRISVLPVAAWFALLIATAAVCTEAQSQYAERHPSQAIYAGVVACIVFGALYFCLMLPFSKVLSQGIYGLVVPKGSEEDGDTKKIASLIALAVSLGLTVILVLLVFDYWVHAQPAAPKPAVSVQAAEAGGDAGGALGTFGDFFGGVLNPMLTFGTLIALAVTILMQRIQLRDARKEAKESGQRAQFQTFETTFFNLLNLHSENVKNLTFKPAIVPLSAELQRIHMLAGNEPKPAPTPIHGRAVFAAVLRSTRNAASRGVSQLAVYRKLQAEHNDVLGHYFRHLYQILNIVNMLVVEGTEKERYKARKRYTNILRAQLSSHELAVLLLNCTFATVDDGKFRDLLVWYKFLEHLPVKENDAMELCVPDVLPDDQWIFFEYFSKDKGCQSWMSGAFGKNPVIARYLERQGTQTWCGPLPLQDRSCR